MSGNRRPAALALFLICWLANPWDSAAACAMFSAVFDGHVYMANNEDYVEPGFVWFVPAGKKRHGRVNLGFADRFVQGSMNDQGLSFDAAVVAEVPYEPEKGKKTPSNLIEKIMDECATVDEAIAYFKKYNCKHLSRTQFLFADRTGASAVVSWMPDLGLDVVRKEGPYQLITNTRLSASSYRCERYVLAERRLLDSTSYSLERLRETLNGIHQRGEKAFTTYSNIFDLVAGTVTVYNLADYEHAVTYDLAEELKKGEHGYELADLFDAPAALETIRAAAPRVYVTEIALPATSVRRFVGSYRVSGGSTEFCIELRDDLLVLVPPDGRVAHLYPEAPALFRLREGGQIRFEMDDRGKVRGLTLYRFGDHYAERVDG